MGEVTRDEVWRFVNKYSADEAHRHVEWLTCVILDYYSVSKAAENLILANVNCGWDQDIHKVY